MGRPKQFDRTMKIKLTRRQQSALDLMSDYLGIPKAQIIREILDVELSGMVLRAHDQLKQSSARVN